MSTLLSPPARKRARKASDEGHSSSNSSDHHSAPPANQQQASADRPRALTAEPAPASPSRSPERPTSAKLRSKRVLYPPGAHLATWPHFVPVQGQVRARDGSSASLDASLYSEVRRIAQQLLQDRKNESARQAAASTVREVDDEPPSAQPAVSPVAPSSSSSSSSSASSPSPTSPMSSRSASSLEFSEDEDMAVQAKHQSPSQDSDNDSQRSFLSAANLEARGGERSLLPDTLLDPLVLGVQARLDALLHAMAMEHSVRQKRASSKKERKKLMGHEEVLDLLQREVEGGPLGTAESQRTKSVLKNTRAKVARVLDPPPAEETTEDAALQLNNITATASALPDPSSSGLLSPAAVQGRESAAQRDAALLLEPFGLLRAVDKRKREAKKKKEKQPSGEVLATEEPVETERPTKSKSQRRQQVIRGGGGFLLCRPPISNASQ